jgi:predicted transcriptional regulator
MVSKTSLLYAISDEITSSIFRNIILAHSKGDILITRLNLTRKQFYSHLSLLTQAGLVKREKGKYLPTAFGKVIYNAMTDLDGKLENALSNYWKLKAIDAIQMLSREESNRLISTLIDDQEIRSILLNEELQLIEAQNKTV